MLMLDMHQLCVSSSFKGHMLYKPVWQTLVRCMNIFKKINGKQCKRF